MCMYVYVCVCMCMCSCPMSHFSQILKWRSGNGDLGDLQPFLIQGLAQPVLGVFLAGSPTVDRLRLGPLESRQPPLAAQKGPHKWASYMENSPIKKVQ